MIIFLKKGTVNHDVHVNNLITYYDTYLYHNYSTFASHFHHKNFTIRFHKPKQNKRFNHSLLVPSEIIMR